MAKETPVQDLLSLEGKGAVVTGAARGIGRGIAARFAEAGAGVVAADMAFEEDNDDVVEVLADVTSLEDMRNCAEAAKKEFGSLDVWVNNAGIFPPLDPVDASEGDFERVVRVNLLGVQNGMQVAAQTMREEGWGGVIINIASTAAYHYAGAYAASKWAVRGMTKGLAAVLGPSGIRVVAIAPTLVDTPGIKELRKTGGKPLEDQLGALESSLPLGRAGEVDDIAKAALFLASDAASFVTGVTLPVDGGELAL